MILLAIWGLACTGLQAQRQLPLSVQPYAGYWDPAINQVLIAAGFTLPGDPSSTEAADPESRSVRLTLDSTLTFISYPDSVPQFRSIFRYPFHGLQMEVESEWIGDSWMHLTQTNTVYDGLGRRVETYAFRYNPETEAYDPDSRLKAFPHGTSADQLDSLFVYGWSEELEDYHRLLATWNEYDSHDRLVRSVSALELFEFPIYFEDYYVYDAAGHLLSITSYNVEGDELIPAGLEEYTYEGDFLVDYVSFVSDGLGGYLPESRTTYTYNDQDLQDTLTYLAMDQTTGKWVETRQDVYGYDLEDRVVYVTTVAATETGSKRTRTVHTYVIDDYPAATRQLEWSDLNLNWVLLETKYYFYREVISSTPDEPVADQALFLWPNPSDGRVELQVSGRQVSVQVYSLAGQLLHRVQLPPGEKMIDLTRLPAGIYQVRARTEDDYFSGKLVIR